MSKTKSAIPEGMRQAALDAWDNDGFLSPESEARLEAALRWLDAELEHVQPVIASAGYRTGYITAIAQVRRMLLTPDDPAVPENLQAPSDEEMHRARRQQNEGKSAVYILADFIDQRREEACRRGQPTNTNSPHTEV